MKILLIEQVKRTSQQGNQFLTRFLTTFSILPTLYIRRLAAITPDIHQTSILNERYSSLTINDEYDLVVIHFTTASSTRAYSIADQFQQIGVTVVLCGLHASALPKEALQHCDAILLGRGECNWLTLLEDIEKDHLSKIYPSEPVDKKTCQIPPTTIVLPGFVIMGGIEATRGCPYQCNFCPEGNTPGADRFYTRPVEDVIAEIKQIPQKIIMFYDASLTINVEYTKELFTKMKSLKKHFFCNGNIDILAHDESFVQLSKEAGCVGWLVGFESFHQKTLDAVGKITNDINDYKKAINLIHSYNMIVIGDFMFGFDNDTTNVFDETLIMLEELQIDAADFTILTPFPGTPLFTRLQKEGRILTTKWEQYTMFNPVFQPKHMSPEQLQQGVQWLYEHFYSPKQTLRRILRNIPRGVYPFSSTMARNVLASFNTNFFIK